MPSTRSTLLRLALACIVTLVATAFTACGDDDNGVLDTYTDFRLDIVTYQGLDADGLAHFDYVGRNDSSTIGITTECAALMPEGLLKGHRALLRYRVDDATPGAWRATTYSLQRIFSDSLRYNNNKPLESYAMHPMRLRSIWRTGDYINLYCQVEYTAKTRALYLMMDSATIDADTVHCYIVHDLLQATDTYQWRNCYASFFVGRLLVRPTCRTLCIHLNDEVFPDRKTYYFNIRK